MEIKDTHYFVWVDAGDHWAVYTHVRRGAGRAARRRLTAVYRFAKPPAGASSPDLVRLLATAMEEQLGIDLSGARAPSAPPGGSRGETLNLDLRR
jgi:hypothetical protein